MKKFKIGEISHGLVVLAFGLLMLILASTVLKNWLIIDFGVRAFNAVCKIAWCIIIASSIATAILSVSQLRVILRYLQTEKQQSQFISNYAENAASPELTRQMLDQLEQGLPAFGTIVNGCRMQMDEMDQLQATQQRLLKTNDALYLSETENTLNRVEQRLCRNIRNIINLCIAASDPARLDSDEIEKITADNRSKLEDATKLIDASVRLINQYIRNHDDDSSEVERWINIILKSLEEDNQ